MKKNFILPTLASLYLPHTQLNRQLTCWDDWLISLCQQLSLADKILPPTVEHLLWKHFLETRQLTSIATDDLIWLQRILCGYQIKPSELTHFSDELDQIVLLLQEFYQQIIPDGYLICAELIETLLPHLADLSPAVLTILQPHVLMARERSFLQALTSHGWLINKLEKIDEETYLPTIDEYPNERQEMAAVLQAITAFLQQRPQACVALAVPEPAVQFITLNQQLHEYLPSDLCWQFNVEPFEFNQFGKIWLDLLNPTLWQEPQRLARVIQSPYLAGYQIEQGARCQLALQLATQPFGGGVERMLVATTQPSLMKLNTCLTQLYYRQQKLCAERLSLCNWLHHWQEFLAPFFTEQGNEQYKRCLDSSIKQLAAYSILFPKLTYNQANSLLVDWLQNSSLPVNKLSPTQLKIVTYEELIGENFDAVWVCNFNNRNWPRHKIPTHLLPRILQKKYQILTTAEHGIIIPTQTQPKTSRIYYSYGKEVDFLTVAPAVPVAKIVPIAAISNIPDSTEIKQNVENIAPPWDPNEGTTISTRALDLISNCPFQAFAELRLGIKQNYPLYTTNINKRERGIILHEVLKKLWQNWQNQETLAALSDEDLTRQITNVLMQVLNSRNYPELLKQLEKEALLPCLKGVATLELNRPYFKIVELEQQHQMVLGGITFTLRIDRLDKNNFGKQILLDYKTGKTFPSIKDWFSERPQHSQLMLYSLLFDALDSLMIIHLNPEQTKIQRISLADLSKFYYLEQNTTELNPPLLTWHDLQEIWRSNLTQLIKNFTSGIVPAVPRSPEICERCGLQTLCRNFAVASAAD